MKYLLNSTLTLNNAVTALRYLLSIKSSANSKENIKQSIAKQLDCEASKLFFCLGGRASLYQSMLAIADYAKKTDGQLTQKVLTPAFTCQCVTNAFNAAGFAVEFIDIELDSFGFCPNEFRQAISKPENQNSIVFIQHTFGLVSPYFADFLEQAKAHGCFIIEDCAHSLGGTFNNQPLGSFADLAFFSAERSKLINTTHGGFVIANHPQVREYLQQNYNDLAEPDATYHKQLLRTLIQNYLANKLPWWRAHLLKTPVPQMQAAEYADQITGQYLLTMPESLLLILEQQLIDLENNHQRRLAQVEKLATWATAKGFKLPGYHPQSAPTWIRYPLLVPSEIKTQVRENPQLFSKETGCEAGVWFTSPMHPKPVIIDNCPNGNYAAKHCINLATL